MAPTSVEAVTGPSFSCKKDDENTRYLLITTCLIYMEANNTECMATSKNF